ncbi:CHASE2 domain-containing protein [Novosphingobium album (ex Hu et al. 2023)]|uniref:Adenylate/guanylate cyclase domain-containing protein n=1 Tax=Novosphingobium album (ex Hu et al. 2023) TaxID=2930093 RepID=A0ABT0AZD7_9SPHN|nr:adenylate/guanylate cyclase domain-containing protein [Novosphingobium album (ex Hu et al. 2023)]MCJ2178172.1 adenylate/guanylate cyclase domain-containing protein [Novosphingobium album (ex Hu et al. 2023)]
MAVLPGLVVILAIAFFQTVQVPVVSQAIERVGFMVFDAYQRLSPRPYEDAPVRIVDIDDETIRRFGQWPWPRTDVARLTMALGEAGAAAVAFDIVFSEKDRTSPRELARRYAASDPQAAQVLGTLPDNDEQFAQVLANYPTVLGFFLTPQGSGTHVEPKAGMVVLGTPPSSVADFRNAITAIPVLQKAAPGSASLSILPDQDSIIRRAPLIQRQGNMMLPALSLEAIRMAFQTDSVMINTTDGSAEGSDPGDVVSLKLGDIEVPTNEQGEMWMHYTRPVPERVVPAWKVLSGALDADKMAELFGGRIVFIGTSAIGLRDLRSTPLNKAELGVMVHAEAAEQMILHKFLYRPDWAVGLERVLLLTVGIGLVLLLPWLGATWGAVLGLGAISVMGGGSWYAFKEWGYLLNPTWPIIGLILGYLIVTVMTFYREEKQRAYIHQAFDRYLAPELVKRIANDPSQLNLGGEERDMTVMFCDVRSFSSISEGLSPDEIIQFLITFLTPMTDLLIENKATIDKYIGDAILAFWNAPLDDPEHPVNAARGALAMVEKLKELNVEMPQRSDVVWPGDVKIGIGLNAGQCCVGNMGSQQRLSYSLIGDTVNLASRIEGLTKYYGVQIAIGSSLKSALPGFGLVELDLVRVVGRDTPEAVYALLGDEALGADEAFQSFAAEHGAMLTAYRSQRWDEAESALHDLAHAAGAYGLTKLYGIYHNRIAAYRLNPPGADWDGVYSAESK